MLNERSTYIIVFHTQPGGAQPSADRQVNRKIMAELLEEFVGGVLTLRLNRPAQRNALARPNLDALQQVLERAATDTTVRCLVLTGTGKGFCAGADVEEWAEAEARGALETYGWTEAAHRMVQALAGFPKPTVAAINGMAFGAGFDLMLACDFRIASTLAAFRSGYAAMGYSPDMGGTWLLPRLVGAEQAKRLVFFDEKVGADEALRIGLVSCVVDAEQLPQATLEWAGKLASAPTFALTRAKHLIDTAATQTLEQQLKAEHQAALLCGRSADAREALQASIEKRSPVFSGK